MGTPGEDEGHADIPREWLEEFEAAAARPLETRMRYAFIRTYKPVLDDATYRAFDTMEENGPFDLDLVFAPDGLESFQDAWNRRVEVEGFPVCHIDDIIASKVAANRRKDRESLPRLQSFREYWLRKQ